jgi:hypothetical protein
MKIKIINLKERKNKLSFLWKKSKDLTQKVALA